MGRSTETAAGSGWGAVTARPTAERRFCSRMRTGAVRGGAAAAGRGSRGAPSRRASSRAPEPTRAAAEHSLSNAKSPIDACQCVHRGVNDALRPIDASTQRCAPRTHRNTRQASVVDLTALVFQVSPLSTHLRVIICCGKERNRCHTRAMVCLRTGPLWREEACMPHRPSPARASTLVLRNHVTSQHKTRTVSPPSHTCTSPPPLPPRAHALASISAFRSSGDCSGCGTRTTLRSGEAVRSASASRSPGLTMMARGLDARSAAV